MNQKQRDEFIDKLKNVLVNEYGSDVTVEPLDIGAGCQAEITNKSLHLLNNILSDVIDVYQAANCECDLRVDAHKITLSFQSLDNEGLLEE